MNVNPRDLKHSNIFFHAVKNADLNAISMMFKDESLRVWEYKTEDDMTSIQVFNLSTSSSMLSQLQNCLKFYFRQY